MLNIFSSFLKQHPFHSTGDRHPSSSSMMAGINQAIFLNQWGIPETRISLDRLHGFFEIDSIALNHEPLSDESHTVWIYEKRDRILFFKKGKLVSHFKWSEFREKWRKPVESATETQVKRTTLLAAMGSWLFPHPK